MIWAIAVLLLSASASESHFRLIHDTTSPHHHYALAWGLKDKKVDWKRLQSEDQTYFSSVLLDDENVANYLVDLRTKRIVSSVNGLHYWVTPLYRENHASLMPAWSRDEHSVVIVYDGKWAYREVV